MPWSTIPQVQQFDRNFRPPGHEVQRDIRTQICLDLELYHQAHSTMARRNVLTSLQQRIQKWMDAQNPQITAINSPNNAMVWLKQVVDRTLGTLTRDRGYTHVRCIAWKVLTGDKPEDELLYFVDSPHDRQDMV